MSGLKYSKACLRQAVKGATNMGCWQRQLRIALRGPGSSAVTKELVCQCQMRKDDKSGMEPHPSLSQGGISAFLWLPLALR